MAKLGLINSNKQKMHLASKYFDLRRVLRKSVRHLGHMITEKEAVAPLSTKLTESDFSLLKSRVANKKNADSVVKNLSNKQIAAADLYALQEFLQSMLHSLPFNSASARVRLRCALTGRPRGVFRSFGIARQEIRRLALLGQLPGVLQSSW